MIVTCMLYDYVWTVNKAAFFRFLSRSRCVASVKNPTDSLVSSLCLLYLSAASTNPDTSWQRNHSLNQQRCCQY